MARSYLAACIGPMLMEASIMRQQPTSLEITTCRCAQGTFQIWSLIKQTERMCEGMESRKKCLALNQSGTPWSSALLVVTFAAFQRRRKKYRCHALGQKVDWKVGANVAPNSFTPASTLLQAHLLLHKHGFYMLSHPCRS